MMTVATEIYSRNCRRAETRVDIEIFNLPLDVVAGSILRSSSDDGNSAEFSASDNRAGRSFKLTETLIVGSLQLLHRNDR